MQTSTLLCAVLAGTFGLSSIAWADDWRGRDRGERAELRHDRREDRREAWREHRRDDRRHAWPAAQVFQPGMFPGYHRGDERPAPRFRRGARLPHEYRGHAYRVNDWHAHPGLYAPPHGHQWMQVGSDFLLVAIATGVIAGLLSQ